MNLQNSTILITGGSSGIGLEFVKQLTEEGATVIITGRKMDALEKAKAQFPNVHIFQSDVSNPKDIEQLYEDVTRQFPKLNIIINNAGQMRVIDLRDTSLSLENINREVASNLTGTIQMVHQFLPHLLKQPSAAIVNTSSGLAFMTLSASPIYSATKSAVRAYTQSLRLQLDDTNVKVFELIPPAVKTSLQDDWEKKPSQNMMMDADKLVKAAVKGIKNDRLEIKPGMAKLLKLLSRIAPNLLLKMAHREFVEMRKAKNN